MNLLQFSRRENRSNRRLQSRRHPMVEGLEGRQLLSGLSAGKASVVADVQKVREAGITFHGVEDVQAARRSASRADPECPPKRHFFPLSEQ